MLRISGRISSARCLPKIYRKHVQSHKSRSAITPIVTRVAPRDRDHRDLPWQLRDITIDGGEDDEFRRADSAREDDGYFGWLLHPPPWIIMNNSDEVPDCVDETLLPLLLNTSIAALGIYVAQYYSLFIQLLLLFSDAIISNSIVYFVRIAK